MVLSLKPGAHIFQGSGSLVFDHPSHDRMLVKVFKTSAPPSKLSDYVRPTKRRYGAFREWYIEYEHYLRLLNRSGRCPEYLPEFHGFQQTSLGVGQVVEKVTDLASDTVSQTLSQFVRRGESIEPLLPLIERFFSAVLRDRAVFRDLNLSNICVVAERGKPVKLVVDDGLGEFTMVQLRSNSKLAHRLWARQAQARLIRRIEHAAMRVRPERATA